jgi:4-hydroxy-tetrahydrodipicolinate synthase
MGGHGGVAGGANMFPRLYVDLYNAAAAKNLKAVIDLHRKVMRISTTLYSVGQHSSSFLKGVKCVLSCKGICSDFMAEPFHRFASKERAQIKAYLEQLESEWM